MDFFLGSSHFQRKRMAFERHIAGDDTIKSYCTNRGCPLKICRGSFSTRMEKKLTLSTPQSLPQLQFKIKDENTHKNFDLIFNGIESYHFIIICNGENKSCAAVTPTGSAVSRSLCPYPGPLLLPLQTPQGTASI